MAKKLDALNDNTFQNDIDMSLKSTYNDAVKKQLEKEIYDEIKAEVKDEVLQKVEKEIEYRAELMKIQEFKNSYLTVFSLHFLSAYL